MKDRLISPFNIGAASGLAALAIYSFSRQIEKGYADIPLHMGVYRDWIAGDPSARAYSMFYVLLRGLEAVTPASWPLSVPVIFMLVCAVIAKFGLSSFILSRAWASRPAIPPYLAALAALLLCLVAPLPATRTYFHLTLGFLPANVWHNSTTMLLMPMAVLQFFLSYRLLEGLRAGRWSWTCAAWVLIVTALSLLAKPSYWMVFAVAFPVFALIQLGLSRGFLLSVGVVLLTTALAAVLFKYIFSGAAEGSVQIAPFQVWRNSNSHIGLAIIASLLFPLALLALSGSSARRDPMLRYAWLGSLIGAAIYALFIETGPRAMHGNFSWQNVPCSFILFLVSLRHAVLQYSDGHLPGWRYPLLRLIFTAHVLAGLFLVSKVEWSSTAF
jgi:hypothetical protein